MILEIIFGIIILTILFFVYIRLKYKFWALQPVYHFYDVYYWFVNVGIIRHNLPEKNKYVNIQKIKTVTFDKLTNKELTDFTRLIQYHYLREKDNIFYPKKDNIVPYFTNHNAPTYISLYYDDCLLNDVKSSKIINEKQLIGAITSRPLNIQICLNNSSKKDDMFFQLYYVDYLCVNRNKRKMGIAPQLIQTIEYEQCHGNKEISVSLFKREEELTGIMPLTVYKVYGFNMVNWEAPSNFTSANYSIIFGDKQNLYYLYNFIKQQNSREGRVPKFNVIIMPEMSNIMELIDTKNIYIIMLQNETEIEAVLFFRKSNTFIEEGKEALSLFASIRGQNTSKEIFIQLFYLAVRKVLTDKQVFHYVLIEDVSDNGLLVKDVIRETYPIINSPCAYFFYNFAYQSFASNKCLIVN